VVNVAAALDLRWRATRLRLAALARLHSLVPWNRTFRVGGQRYRYAFHGYNTTWRNERCVEIPLAIEILDAWHEKRILEVGNVLSHYRPVDHDVLDKYERAPRVVNEDVLEFRPSAPYDLIFSVSTMEHIGWDETTENPRRCWPPSSGSARCWPLGAGSGSASHVDITAIWIGTSTKAGSPSTTRSFCAAEPPAGSGTRLATTKFAASPMVWVRSR
jgi:hypothetical protein